MKHKLINKTSAFLCYGHQLIQLSSTEPKAVLFTSTCLVFSEYDSSLLFVVQWSINGFRL